MQEWARLIKRVSNDSAKEFLAGLPYLWWSWSVISVYGRAVRQTTKWIQRCLSFKSASAVKIFAVDGSCSCRHKNHELGPRFEKNDVMPGWKLQAPQSSQKMSPGLDHNATKSQAQENKLNLDIMTKSLV